jgi:hypothetical protein
MERRFTKAGCMRQLGQLLREEVARRSGDATEGSKWTEAKRLAEAGMESCSEEDSESEDEVEFLAELEFDMPDCS